MPCLYVYYCADFVGSKGYVCQRKTKHVFNVNISVCIYSFRVCMTLRKKYMKQLNYNITII